VPRRRPPLHVGCFGAVEFYRYWHISLYWDHIPSVLRTGNRIWDGKPFSLIHGMVYIGRIDGVWQDMPLTMATCLPISCILTTHGCPPSLPPARPPYGFLNRVIIFSWARVPCQSSGRHSLMGVVSVPGKAWGIISQWTVRLQFNLTATHLHRLAPELRDVSLVL